jgi:hypothetical protein
MQLQSEVDGVLLHCTHLVVYVMFGWPRLPQRRCMFAPDPVCCKVAQVKDHQGSTQATTL